MTEAMQRCAATKKQNPRAKFRGFCVSTDFHEIGNLNRSGYAEALATDIGHGDSLGASTPSGKHCVRITHLNGADGILCGNQAFRRSFFEPSRPVVDETQDSVAAAPCFIAPENLCKFPLQ